MKRVYSVTILLLLVASHIFSQTIGINAGILGSNLYPTTKGEVCECFLNNYKTRVGYSIGVNLNFNLPGESMSIESTLMYTNLGAKYSYPDGPIPEFGSGASTVSFPLTLKLNYIYLPILFSYNLSRRLNWKIGPQVGYLFSGKVSDDDNFTDGLSVEDLNEFNSMIALNAENEIDIGINAGLGYELNPNIDVSLNFYNGFQTVKKIVCSQCPNEWEINRRNRYLSISVSYALSIK